MHPVHVIIGTDTCSYLTPSRDARRLVQTKSLSRRLAIHHTPSALRKEHNALCTRRRVILHLSGKERQRVYIVVRGRLDNIQM